MKINKLIWISITAILFACNDMDVPPMNILSDSDIFNSESGIMSYMARMYNDLPVEMADGENTVNHFTGESATCNYSWIGASTSPRGDYWNYGHVRNVNYFLQEFPKYATSFTEANANTWLGEARFIRAFTYFAMTLRYGGIPIVKEVVNYNGQDIESLRAPRDKEVDCYNFVISDLDEAIRLLPATNADGRVNKYVAYGLKARVALWAASIARYGTVQLDGILGVPSDQARAYYEMAHAAATETAKGGYELYNDGSGDLTTNFTKIFLDKSSNESMFVKLLRYPDNGTSLDLNFTPWQIRGPQNYSSRANPTLDFVEKFDDIDGNPFILNTGTDENPVLYEDRMDIFAKAEPRLKATVIFPGDVFKGEVIDVRKGIVPAGEPVSNFQSTASFGDMYEDMSIQGASGIGHNEATVTGFYMRKLLDPNLPRANVASGRSENPWINMRYAEMLLIRAEAAVELNNLGDNSKMNDAVECMRLIRERAGAKKVYTADDLINTDDPAGIYPKGTYLVRKERWMELFFESKIYWDLKRWRTFDKEVENRQWNVLWPIYVWDQKKYYMKRTKYTEFTFNFIPTYYYLPISGSEIQRNPLLVPNPGY
ncbi:MAG: RagB/SusD family nutrient uptake outer membrane protein [Tannerellaceae bacterium]|jgi:hypothetical protein|nr:RagB/SusD family nutrient uptake outer membrane protein [Tannerellaceae bacterium]